MRTSKLTALLLAIIVVMGGVLVHTAFATHTSRHKIFTGGTDVKALAVNTNSNAIAVTSVLPNWTTVESRGFSIRASESQLVVMDYSAETRCAGTTSFCVVRALVGRTLATARVLEPARDFYFSISSTGSQANEGHAVSRALCIRNAAAGARTVKVWFQASRFDSNVTDFTLIGSTFKVARSSPCSPAVTI